MAFLNRALPAFIAGAAFTSAAVAQAVPDAAQPTEAVVPYLFYFTFAAVLLVLIGSLAYFLRKPSNRDATAKGLGLDDGDLNKSNGRSETRT